MTKRQLINMLEMTGSDNMEMYVKDYNGGNVKIDAAIVESLKSFKTGKKKECIIMYSQDEHYAL